MAPSPEINRNRSGNLLLWVFVGLGIYVLSFGPAAKYYMTNPGAKIEEALVAAYTPILWLMEYTPLRAPFEFYLKLWGVSFG